MVFRKPLKSRLYYKAINLKQLEKAWRHVRKSGFNSNSVDTRREINKFDEDWESELKAINQQVKTEKFDFSGSRGHKLKKPGKLSIRPLVLFPVRIRVLQRSILDALQECKGIKKYLDNESSFGGLKGKSKGVPGAVRRITKLVEETKFSYIIRSDIISFFTKIPLNLVISKIREDVHAEEDFIELLESVTKPELENMHEMGKDTNFFDFTEEGTPQGCCLSPLIANIFLHNFDFEMNQGDIRCIRYLDDFLILAKSEHSALGGLKKARKLLSELNLEIHLPEEQTDKASMGHINKPFEFLGLEFDFKNKLIRPTGTNSGKLKTEINKILTLSIKKINTPNERNDERYSMLSTLSLVSNKVKGWGKTFAIACGEYHDNKTFIEIEKNIHKKLIDYLQKVNHVANFNTNRKDWSRIIGVHLLSNFDC